MPIDVPRFNPAVAALALTDQQQNPLGVQDYKLRQYEREKLDYNREELTRKRITGGQTFDDDQRVRAAVQQWGHDPERLEQEVSRIDPLFGAEFKKRWQNAREATIKADIEETNLHKQEGELGISLLQGIGDDQSYQIALPQIRKLLPELGATLPDHYDPEKVSTALQYGLKGKELADMRLDMYKFISSGDVYQAAAMAYGNPATDTQQEWDDATAALKGMGIKQAVLDVFGDFDEGDGPKRAINLGMTIKERRTLEETNRANEANEAERGLHNTTGEVETERHNRAMEGVAGTRAAAAGAAKAGAAGKAADPDVATFADHYMAGHPEVLVGKTPTLQGAVEAEVLRRGGELALRRVKLPAALQTRVLDAEQGQNELDTLKPLMKEEWLGPAAGRWQEFYTSLPGTERPKDYAQFVASTYTLYNKTISAITGAAVQAAEEVRIKKQIPSIEDKPTQWLANWEATQRNLIYLAQRALKINGATDEMIAEYTAEREELLAKTKRPTPPGATRQPAPPAAPAAGFSFKLPDGRTATFKTQADMDKAKAALGIR